jgi:hypothetical protein
MWCCNIWRSLPHIRAISSGIAGEFRPCHGVPLSITQLISGPPSPNRDIAASYDPKGVVSMRSSSCRPALR